jgi:hypothetical protein
MTYSSRVFLWAPLVLLLALALGTGARWWWVAQDLSHRLERMNGHEAVPGVTFDFSSKTVGGFPFNVDVVLHDLTLAVRGPHGLVGWRTEDFAAHSLTYGHSQWIYEAAGRQKLSWKTRSGITKGLEFDIGSLHASSALADGALERFDFDLVGFASPALAIARTQFHLRRNPNSDQLDIVGSAEEIHLSPRLRGLCGDTIDHIKFDGDFSNGSTLRGVLAGAARWQAGFEVWRKRGGRLFLAQSELNCSRSSVFAQGQLGLDEANRPRGLVTAQIAGFDGLREGASRSPVQGAFANALVNQTGDLNPAQEGRVTIRAAFRDGLTWLGNTPAGTNDPLY